MGTRVGFVFDHHGLRWKIRRIKHGGEKCLALRPLHRVIRGEKTDRTSRAGIMCAYLAHYIGMGIIPDEPVAKSQKSKSWRYTPGNGLSR